MDAFEAGSGFLDGVGFHSGEWGKVGDEVHGHIYILINIKTHKNNFGCKNKKRKK